MAAKPLWSVSFSADCPNVRGFGFRCMICGAEATGHATVHDGPHDGRCLAVLCPGCASEEGWEPFKAALLHWTGAGLIGLADGGPGPLGEPEVWHDDGIGEPHWDPMPSPEHDQEVPDGTPAA